MYVHVYDGCIFQVLCNTNNRARWEKQNGEVGVRCLYVHSADDDDFMHAHRIYTCASYRSWYERFAYLFVLSIMCVMREWNVR